MSARLRLTFAGAFATLLASTALTSLFAGGAWFPHVFGAVVVVGLTGALTRRLGVPRVLQPLLALVTAAYFLLVTSLGADLAGGLVPTGHSLDALRVLVDQGRADIADYGPPVPTTHGMVLLATAGVAGIAVVVDLLAVVLQRAALAGLGLLALYAIPSAVLPGGLPWWPFAFGAVGWLVLLLVEGSERVDRWGTPMRGFPGARHGEDSSLGRVGRRIGGAALGLAVIVPALLPGLDHQLLGGNGSGGSGSGSGSSKATTFNPFTGLGTTLNDKTTVNELSYTVKGTTTPDYLRLTTLNTYSSTDAVWSATTLSAKSKTANVNKGIAQNEDLDGPSTSTKVHIDALKDYWLPVPFGPTKVKVDGRWLWDAASETVFSSARATLGLADYTVTATRTSPTAATLEAAAAAPPPDVLATYLPDPAPAVSGDVSGLTAKLTSGKTTPYDKALAIQDYFTDPANGFTYDQQPGLDPSDPLTSFFKLKVGFCQQYASAMAVMLRLAGVPARVAVGFTPGTMGKDGVYTVTNKNAHAWPEAYFTGVGWVRFEPTPPATGNTVPAYAVPAGPGTTTAPGTTVTAPDPTASPTPAKGGLRDRDTDPDGNPRLIPTLTTTPSSSSSSAPSLSVVVLVVVVLLVVGPYVLTLLRRRQRRARGDVSSLWAQVQDDAADTGFTWRRSESPRAAASRLTTSRRLSGDPAAALERVAAATERQRYAPDVPQSQDTSALAADVRSVRAALHEGAPASVRWRAAVLPPSTLTWAGEGIGRATGSVMSRVDTVFAVLGRLARGLVPARRTRMS